MAYLWQQHFAGGPARSPQIPAHHDGDVASTRLARLVETVLLSADLDFLGFGISPGFPKFNFLLVLRLSQNLDDNNDTCIGRLVIVGER